MNRKAGRPGPAERAERERRKRAWSRKEKWQRWMESQITRGRIDDDANAAKTHFDLAGPSTQLLLTGRRTLDKLALAIALLDLLDDLLGSDKPLDREQLQGIARSAAGFLKAMKQSPKERRRTKDRAFIDWVATWKEHLGGFGLTMKEAEQEIAEARGWTSATLKKNLQRARKNLRKVAK